MSWWEAGPDLLCDEGVDAIADVCSRLAAVPNKPSLAQLLAAAAQALDGVPGAPAAGKQIVAQPPAPAAKGDSPVPEPVVRDFQLAFGRIAGIYQDRWKRPPTVSEILGLLAFHLRVVPRAYVSPADAERPLNRLLLDSERTQ